jgi:hypothetical protein
MREHQRVVQLAGAVLRPQSHVCAFFHSLDEQYRVLLPFIKEGLVQGGSGLSTLSTRAGAANMYAVWKRWASTS